METEKKLLEVGDKLICHSNWHGKTIVTIDRVTAKRAYIGTIELNREITSAGWRERGGRSVWNRDYYTWPTPELLEEVAEEEKRRELVYAIKTKIGKDAWKQLPIAQLEQLIELLKPVNPESK